MQKERERERCVCVCARAEQKLSRQTRERERERGVCVCWESKNLCSSTGDSLRLNKVWVLFLKGQKSLKVSALLLSWQH